MLNKSVKLPRGLSSVTRRFFHPGVAILLGLAVAGPRPLERLPKLSNGLSQRIRSSLMAARCRESFATAASAPILASCSRRRRCAFEPDPVEVGGRPAALRASHLELELKKKQFGSRI
jgi:hypothetical protein